MTFSRRIVLQLSLALAAAGPTPVLAAPRRARVMMLSDLHSSYGRLAQLLAQVDRVIARDPSPCLMLLNGDLFEAGNVVARRSQGVIDWAFLAALSKRCPVVFNLGNHDADLVDDLVKTVARAQALGITVLSDIDDARTGKLLAPSETTIDLGFPVRVLGIATPALGTYPEAIRPTLRAPSPTAWARDELAKGAPVGGLLVLMSHAGLDADREILPLLPDGTLCVGGHDHLTLIHEMGRSRYVHPGAGGVNLSVATLDPANLARPVRVEQIAIDADGPADKPLAALIAATMKANLTPAETEVVAHLPKALSLGDTGRKVAAIMAKAADADIGFIGHTTLGAGLPAGEVTQYAFDAAVRFDGGLMVATVDAATARAILARGNQDGGVPFDRRTGDSLYGAPDAPPTKAWVRIVTTDWCARHQASYFGREDLAFTAAPGLRLKAAVKSALAESLSR